jgi:hypothetical protein
MEYRVAGRRRLFLFWRNKVGPISLGASASSVVGPTWALEAVPSVFTFASSCARLYGVLQT